MSVRGFLLDPPTCENSPVFPIKIPVEGRIVSAHRVGLGLWQSVPATLIVEGALYAAGIAAYVHATRPLDQIGRFALWSLLIACAAMWASGPFSPPPPSPKLLAWATFGVYVIVLWAGWADSHRVLRTALA